MRRLANNSSGFSALIATLMTIFVLLVLGSVMYLMAVSVTPGGMPAMGAMSSTRNDSGNYTVTVIALTNHGIERDEVSIIVYPENSTTYASKIDGAGNHLSLGDSFRVGNLNPGTTYIILIKYQSTESVIASIEISAY